ncbi:carboxyl-terminal processing protease [Paenibacillus cellulosilyticus]|uniref:Carboxyl-terminal processing protease n=1 Tax=Paenibacillus cellulosilyticus TaxID=375489 RepID=A0A2V2YU60_9BACL|nr:S41 family peptidase [Paenibacillus cellulosilyticus]PWW02466.1 carboxyl-terminal processing protease [Paenibacillus cellulosilyticus]QKS47172.1 S41 family peptidase [Paenibacillus cellulosilyticus]
MKIFASQIARQRFAVICLLGAVLAGAAGFAGGVVWTRERHPILKEATFNNLSASYNEIMKEYLNGAEPKALIDGATEGMVKSLNDKYSKYLIGDNGEAYVQNYESEVVGIGIQLRQEDNAFIIDSVIKDSPAEKAGLKADDTLQAVEGTSIKGMELDKLIEQLRGEIGSKVSITVSRPEQTEPITVTMTRATIPVLTVTYEMKDDGIGYVVISRFAQKTADQFKDAIADLTKQGMKGLLLDVRSNPGGLLVPTITIADQLIPKGKTILQVVSKEEKSTQTYKSKQTVEWKLPIVVLTNRHSASAAEVLTAALKESAGATVVGETTYGKGVVQRFSQFKDLSVLSLTEAQWRTPKGNWINGKGVEPDVKVSLPDYTELTALPTGTIMKQGDYGDSVKTLQQMLKALGYDPAGAADGVYDEATKSAVIRFQKAEGIEPANGETADSTMNKLMEELQEKLKKEDYQEQKGSELLKGLIASITDSSASQSSTK